RRIVSQLAGDIGMKDEKSRDAFWGVPGVIDPGLSCRFRCLLKRLALSPVWGRFRRAGHKTRQDDARHENRQETPV
ncbi:MAG: hypothetical protein ACRESO_07535, partial [Gammaproteobacteria bacterium]